MVRPERFELPTFWFVAVTAGNLSALCGVASGYFAAFYCSSVVVRNLSGLFQNALYKCLCGKNVPATTSPAQPHPFFLYEP